MGNDIKLMNDVGQFGRGGASWPCGQERLLPTTVHPSSSLGRRQRLFQFREDLKEISHGKIVAIGHDGGIFIGVDGDDGPRGFHTGEMLDRPDIPTAR
jgi:hypothetical protein